MNTTELNQQPRVRAYSSSREGLVAPQACTNCNGTGEADASAPDITNPFVYALGRVEGRFPSTSLQQEFVQATGRAKTDGKTDQQMFQSLMSERKNRYLARQLCWVLTVQGLETYVLQPRDPLDLDLLVAAIRPAPSPMDIDAVIGLRGPMAPPEMCNGLVIPIVYFDQIYSFDREALMTALPRPDKMSAKTFEASANELFERVIQLTDNAGAMDEHRALNYLAMRYPAIYSTVADAHGRDASLTAVEVNASTLSGTRNIVEVIFSFTNRQNEFTEKYFVRVDVTDEFPFRASRMAPYFDR